MDKYKHLDLEARITIEIQLDRLESFHGIGSLLGKDCTTISKEVRGHRVFEKTGAIGIAFRIASKGGSYFCKVEVASAIDQFITFSGCRTNAPTLRISNTPPASHMVNVAALTAPHLPPACPRCTRGPRA